MTTRQGPPGPGGGLWSPPPGATLSDVPPFPALESLLAGSLFPDEPSGAGFFDGLPSPPPSPPPPPPPPSSTAFLRYPQEMLTLPSELTSQHLSSSVTTQSKQEKPDLLSATENVDAESTGPLQGLQCSFVALERPADDGYNWRKYGQKTLKGGEYLRSYYRCSHGRGNCLVRKNVEHSADGRIIQIIYRGQHNHERPPKRRFRGCGGLSNELNDFKDNDDVLNGSQSDFPDCYGKPIILDDTMADCLMARREEGDDQLSGSCDSHEENDCDDANSNERNAPSPGQKIIVSTTSEVDILDDGYKWRKYGQKVVKGNPHPRSYYRCTYQGCDVKKHVERSRQEPNAVITTYEGKHIHDVPATRSRRHATDDTQAYCTETTYRTITC